MQGQIYHDGSNSYIDDTGTGQLYIRGSAQIHLENGPGTEKYARFERNGTVELYYDNSKKFETTSTATKDDLVVGPTVQVIEHHLVCPHLACF